MLRSFAHGNIELIFTKGDLKEVSGEVAGVLRFEDPVMSRLSFCGRSRSEFKSRSPCWRSRVRGSGDYC